VPNGFGLYNTVGNVWEWSRIFSIPFCTRTRHGSIQRATVRRPKSQGAQRFFIFRCGESVEAAVAESHASSRKNRFRISHLVGRRQNSLFASATMTPKMPPIPQRQAGCSVLAHPHAFRSPESTSPNAFFPNKLNLTSGKYGDDNGEAAYARPAWPAQAPPMRPVANRQPAPFLHKRTRELIENTGTGAGTAPKCSPLGPRFPSPFAPFAILRSIN
jgi:hypothetical protein